MNPFGDPRKLMKQLQQAQERIQAEIAALVVEASSDGGMVKVEMDGQKQLRSLRIDPAAGAVNASALKDTSNENLKAFVKLADVLGKILSQIRKGSLQKLTISFKGELFQNSSKLLSTALLKGFLTEELDSTVNYINAPLLAEEMGIVLEEIISTENKDYLNLIETKIMTNSGEWKFSGTVFGSNELRIVETNNFPVEFKPEGNILIYKNIDKPGMFEPVRRELSLSNINIAGLSLGRKTEGDYALTIVNIDSR